MNDTKPALSSLGVWGGLLAVVPSVLEALGQGLGIGITAGEVTSIGTNLLAAIGGALAIWGRVRATKRIG